jgi:hypothetical protein
MQWCRLWRLQAVRCSEVQCLRGSRHHSNRVSCQLLQSITRTRTGTRCFVSGYVDSNHFVYRHISDGAEASSIALFRCVSILHAKASPKHSTSQPLMTRRSSSIQSILRVLIETPPLPLSARWRNLATSATTWSVWGIRARARAS